ncbi:MAG: hypothetical protein AMJ75_00985 [Phycisphaerae bacterium SM1_79]|nr:MAG: hypothetical protein AMJ75_00985 [Phycisphaerae bacterium SM1_79]
MGGVFTVVVMRLSTRWIFGLYLEACRQVMGFGWATSTLPANSWPNRMCKVRGDMPANRVKPGIVESVLF